MRTHILILIMILICACTDMAPQRQELSVVPAAGTKGVVPAETLVDDATGDRTLTLSGWMVGNGGQEGNFFVGYEFRRDGTSQRWRHTPPVYLPVESRLDLLGYSSSAPFDDADVTWGWPNSAERFRLVFGPERLDDDVLFGASYGVTSATGLAQMRMEHSQAIIEVRFVRDAEAHDTPVYIRAITLEEVFTSGELTVEANSGLPYGTWKTRRFVAEDLVMPDGGLVYGHNVTTSLSSLRVLLPEQAQTAIVIDYDVDGELKTWRHDLPHTDWVMGRHYIYDIIFDPVQAGNVSLTVTVADWNSGEPFNESI